MKSEMIKDRIESLSHLFERALRKSFSENRDYLEYLLFSVENSAKDLGPEKGGEGADATWIAVDSISKLRGEVGGRFDALKTKWQDAGLPLKQKKGDKIPSFQINPAAWADLEAWLLKMGYAARLVQGKEDRIFEIKKML